MKDILELKHTTKKLPEGGRVIILNTGSAIGPEAEAMLQALHSRSVDGVNSHLQKLAQRGADKFMSTYYVGYGHKSIGDLGTITIFIEGVSMLAAKAIQDWPLYSGQESSTRYVDYSVQPFIDPLSTKKSSELLENWREFYLKGLGTLKDALREHYPRQDGEEESIYTKAINARAFDIMRGFLPAGASTNLAWHSNLRQISDKISLLRHHPLQEVRAIAKSIEEAVLEAFPSSFSSKRYELTENYNKSWVKNLTYFDAKSWPDFEMSGNTVDTEMLGEYEEFLTNRPPKTELPKYIAECGNLQFKFLLDFGSFRDVQRHRAVHQRMPLITMRHGFESWYLEELPASLREQAKAFLAEQSRKIEELGASLETKQYYIGMGYRLPNRITGNLHALVYLVELRGTRFVHPTLRKRSLQMAGEVVKNFGKNGLVLHLDHEPDRFDIKRGEHDIVEK